MQISENAKANTVSSKGQLEETKYVKITRVPDAAVKVLFVGNSITRHGPAPQIGWTGDWGMAASSEEKDYVHRAVAMLTEKYGAVSFCVAQGAVWERGYWEDEALLDEHYRTARDFEADIVFIRIGENIPRDKAAEIPVGPHYERMVRYFAKNPHAAVICTDNFWKIELLDSVFRETAAANGWRFVQLHDLETIEGTMALGLFEHGGVAHHPGDYGMELIARRIVAAVPMSFGENPLKLQSSMVGASFIYDEGILTSPDYPYADCNRGFQGIPGITVTAGGRFYSVFYAGSDGEGAGNFLVVHQSDDGVHFRPFCAVVPTAPGVRCFDAVPWTGPDGKVRLFWAQSYGLIDGRIGTWCAVLDDADGRNPRFLAPRRVGNGIMMNKPIVTRDGAWLAPLAIWPGSKGPHDLAGERFCNVYRSDDGGESYTRIGGCDAPGRSIDEHMLYEKRDGSLRMLIRVGGGIGICDSISTDGGVTWAYGRDAGIGGPDSRFFVGRLQSGRLLLVNHKNFSGRNNLTAMLSDDDGATWNEGLLLDARSGVSYPDVCQTADGRIHIIYDYNRYSDREILLASITEADIDAGCVGEGSRLGKIVAKADAPVRLVDGGARNGENFSLLALANGEQVLCAPDCCLERGFGTGLGVTIAPANGCVWRGYIQLDGRAGCHHPQLSEEGGVITAAWMCGEEKCRAVFTLRDIHECRISVTN